ncbi:hypothetical protein VNO77_19137 [Canavalia gladiata]|uniref:Uncharacterized protein n=1 Tax=Canavalia gladiata TaxID=3824 RepID=A0AAN9QI94_CANGL
MNEKGSVAHHGSPTPRGFVSLIPAYGIGSTLARDESWVRAPAKAFPLNAFHFANTEPSSSFNSEDF